MYNLDIALALRNALFFQFLVILLLPDHAVAVHQHLQKIWRRIRPPLLEKKQTPKKRNGFWEIDLTKLEP